MKNKIGLKICLLFVFLVYSPVLAAVNSSFVCGGTEPFWKMTISPAKIKFENYGEEKKISLKPVKPEAVEGIKPEEMLVYKTKTFTGEPVTMIIKHVKAGCSDEMSDKLYKFSVDMIFPNQTFTGCCDSQK